MDKNSTSHCNLVYQTRLTSCKSDRLIGSMVTWCNDNHLKPYIQKEKGHNVPNMDVTAKKISTEKD